MPDAIEIEGLGKRYLLGVGTPRYLTLRESLTSRVTRRREHHRTRELWALREVDLSLEQGGSLGIIGPNGAGKTTLLRVLARITQPTVGVARVRGRMTALLELGTGFHPELTGRENIYLNAAILGMSRRDVRSRFDDIVDFAGVEGFLDTPLKRYSSGMSVRLAFSVAAHLEPDIVVVDEVLAVGDAEFQRRCLGKMSEMEHEGRTVLFVSHDVGAIGQLCERVIWLDHGRVRDDGVARAVIERYLSHILSLGNTPTFARAPADADVDIVSVSLSTSAGTVMRGDPFEVVLGLMVRRRVPGLDLAVVVRTPGGVRVIDEAWGDRRDPPQLSAVPGQREVRLTLPGILAAGRYIVEVWLGTSERNFFWEDVLRFDVVPRFDDRREWAHRDRLVQVEPRWDDDR
jgi:ABC-2 type transport system ATP-binding protein/lipopolysaccharide transport system ATP-binding protein